MSASDDDDGIVLIPIGPGSGFAADDDTQRLLTRLKPLAPFASGLAAVAGFLIAFANNPFKTIITVFNTFIVGTVLAAGRWIIGAILWPFQALAGAFDAAGNLLTGALGAAGLDILGALLAVQQQVAAAVSAAGPAGPPLAVGLAAVGIWVMFRVGSALLVLIPGGDSLLTLIGQR